MDDNTTSCADDSDSGDYYSTSYVTGECIEDESDVTMSYQAGCNSDGYLTLATYLNDEDCSGSYAHVTTFGLSDTDYCLTADSCANTDDPTPEPTFYSMTPSPIFTT